MRIPNGGIRCEAIHIQITGKCLVACDKFPIDDYRLLIYQKYVYFFWAMHSYYQRFFNISCTAGACCKCD
jgi:hypothetical protein